MAVAADVVTISTAILCIQTTRDTVQQAIVIIYMAYHRTTHTVVFLPCRTTCTTWCRISCAANGPTCAIHICIWGTRLIARDTDSPKQVPITGVFYMCEKFSLKGPLKKKVNFEINATLKHKTEFSNYKQNHKKSFMRQMSKLNFSTSNLDFFSFFP